MCFSLYPAFHKKNVSLTEYLLLIIKYYPYYYYIFLLYYYIHTIFPKTLTLDHFPHCTFHSLATFWAFQGPEQGEQDPAVAPRPLASSPCLLVRNTATLPVPPPGSTPTPTFQVQLRTFFFLFCSCHLITPKSICIILPPLFIVLK